MLATNNPKSMQRIKKTQFEPIPLLLDHIEANKLWRTIKIPNCKQNITFPLLAEYVNIPLIVFSTQSN